MNKPFIVFITGASGVGKTTLVDNLKEKYKDNTHYAFEHFDSIGVPSAEEMDEKFGSGEAWQEAMMHQWVERLIRDYHNKEVVVFEGQVNIAFIRNACQKNNVTNYTIILIDVNEEDMISRLIHDRKQPELVTDNMKNWRCFYETKHKNYMSLY